MGYVLMLVLLAAPALAQLPPIDVTAPRQTPQPPPEPPQPPPPVVERPTPMPDQPGRGLPLTNTPESPYSASQGVITQFDIENRPSLRTTDFLELVPGLVVTQHSGQGKANQYFLRGFALDHGTDFAGFVDDVPYNLPSNSHGQGYLDLNSVIPELVGIVDFRKGPYYADVGDFSSAGSVNIHLRNDLPYSFFKIEGGMYDWYRTVIASSIDLGPGHLLYAFEGNAYNGPFEVHENFNRYVGVLKYTIGDDHDGMTMSAIGYNAQGNLANQIPLRATSQGLISSFGVEDPSDYLTTTRFTLNNQWWHHGDNGSITRGNIYGVYYSLNIFSNFTFFLNDPVHGDQINQIDRRWITGGNISHQWNSNLFGDRVVNTVGFQVRNDSIPHLGLHNTEQRQFLSAVSDDSVHEINLGPYISSQVKWAEKVRSVIGARGDYFHFDDVSKDTPANSGHAEAKLFSPKGSLVLGPWNHTEFYLNGGFSFHSNDARGVVGSVDPTTGEPVSKSPGLVRSKGAEIGMRTQVIPNLTSGVALWQLHLDQELVFSGDSGTTEPLRASDRYGIEWTNNYRVNDWLTWDADYSWSHGRLLGTDPDVPGNYIPEAVTTVFSGGPSIRLPNGLFSELRFRYFGPRALIEDNSAHSRATQLFELSMGYQCPRYTFGIELLNLFNSNGHDIDYFYGSALKTDPGFPFPPGDPGVQDIHFKRVEPFAFRVYYTLRW
jgi:hypothetical protein